MAGEDRLGNTPLFLGVETQYWTLTQFQQATQTAKALGITSLLVKVADGTSEWYGGINGRQQVLNAVIQAGLPAIPYTYCYGDSFGGLQGEIALLASIMQQNGIVVADMEAEYNGQVNWAQAVCSALKPVSGAFSVTTWADPNLQNWQGVLSALAPCVDFWLPQVYSNFLAGVYQAQFAPYGRPYYPILNLGDDFGANDIIQIAKAANKSIVGFWEHQAAITTHASIVKQLATQNGGGGMSGVPQGWHYDENTKVLTAPNGTQVTDGFAQWILTHTWAADDLPRMGAIGLNPVELGNPALGGGTVQPFNKTILVWTKATGVYPMYAGKEYIALYQQLSQARLDLKSAQSQVTILQQQVKQLQDQQPTPQPAKGPTANDIENAGTSIKASIGALNTALSDLGVK